MPLTEITIRQAKPTERPRKLFDGGGLYLFITSQGGKYWRYRYRFAGKDRTLSLGAYREVSLKQARQLHREAKSLLYQGIDQRHDNGNSGRVTADKRLLRTSPASGTNTSARHGRTPNTRNRSFTPLGSTLSRASRQRAINLRQ